MKIVFFGTADFAEPVLSSLVQEHEVSLVVTGAPKPRGRGKKLVPTGVHLLADKLGIPVETPKSVNTEEFLERLKKENAEVFVVAAFGQILKTPLLELIHRNILNVHGSILPTYRGAAPIERAILDGNEEIGVSIMKIEEGLDSGDVAKIVRVPLEGRGAQEMRHVLACEGAKALLEVLDEMEEGTVVFTPQCAEEATFAPKIEKEEGYLHPREESAEQVVAKIRGLDSYRGASIPFGEGRMKIFRGTLSEGNFPGLLCKVGEDLFLGCADGAVRLDEIQIPGKKRMLTRAFLLGHPWEGDCEVN